jgi:hypothetical protein
MTKPPKTPRPPKPPIQSYPGNKAPVMTTIGLVHEKLIGRVSTQWAVLEACMGGAIIELLRVDYEAGRYIKSHAWTLQPLIRLLRELGQLRLPEPDFHKLSSICDRIDIRREDRNLIIHGTWSRADTVSDPHAMSLRIKPENPAQIISETFSTDRLRAIIAEIQSLRKELVDLLRLDELLDKRREPPPLA